MKKKEGKLADLFKIEVILIHLWVQSGSKFSIIMVYLVTISLIATPLTRDTLYFQRSTHFSLLGPYPNTIQVIFQ
jgi:hypothetical protein